MPLLLLFSYPFVSDFVNPWSTASQASLSFTISWSLPKFMSIASVMPSSHLNLWCPLVLLPSIFPSIRDFTNESAVCIRWSKYYSFSLSISPSNEYPGLISLKIDWFYLFAVQETLRNLLPGHSLKASIIWRSAFFMVHLSQPYVTTLEDHSFDYTDLCWVMSLLVNTLSRFAIAFLPRSNCLLISWFQSTSAVILEPMKRKCHYSTFCPSICHKVMGLDAIILVFLIFIFKLVLSLSFPFIKRLFSSSSLSTIRVVSPAYQVVDVSPAYLDTSL